MPTYPTVGGEMLPFVQHRELIVMVQKLIWEGRLMSFFCGIWRAPSFMPDWAHLCGKLYLVILLILSSYLFS